ncbi:MAG: hypothetical protein KDA61_12780, partial [Planctomycetales bacterium]|nr:hypothetical protein [Planctomycetales bacterium]
MIRLIATFALVACFHFFSLHAAAASDRYERHAVFTNSQAADSYFHSRTYVVAPSELGIEDGRLPVSSDRFVSPPNALRLQWTSHPSGDWSVTVETPQQYGHRPTFSGAELSLWCYAVEPLKGIYSPRVRLEDAAGRTLPERTLLLPDETLPAGAWKQIRIPLTQFTGLFEGTRPLEFDATALRSVTFVQGLDDDVPHELYLDDIRLAPAQEPESPLPAPRRLQTSAYERHVDLSWEPSDDERQFAVRIYRSLDDGPFEPIDQRPGTARRAVDYVGPPPVRAAYRITAVDLHNRESSPSEAALAVTQSQSDDALLDMTQEACFRYYWENAHPVSGLAPEIV